MSLFQDIPAGSPTPGGAPAAITSGTLQPAPAAAPQAPNNMMLYTVVPMFAVMAIMMYTSSRKQKKEQEARKGMKKGDRVLSQSGLVGELVEMDEKIAKVKLAPGITVTMLSSSIGLMDAVKDETKDLADLRDAKAAADKK
jgi:preprotein translocase subunit YajC